MIVEQVPDARVARDLGGLHRGRVVVEDVVCDLHEAGPARALGGLVQQAHELRVERGLQQANAGKTVSHDEVKERLLG